MLQRHLCVKCVCVGGWFLSRRHRNSLGIQEEERADGRCQTFAGGTCATLRRHGQPEVPLGGERPGVGCWRRLARSRSLFGHMVLSARGFFITGSHTFASLYAYTPPARPCTPAPCTRPHTPSPPSITKTHTLPRGVTPKTAPHTRSLQACC
ncbi:hypothetical protein BGZ61DRAFT_23641 [Ilyonectria robusta]|uniref:uncharacterized protein n=1 Tax=Ilyonectria robusta TaxID=1079257 RepID=UPI001E8D67A8|nr:uncharacterized protein BGZ61DRAFT_23641 [Ilyonectria robusta]KAH8737841.1 hypothetical protein BGZ61DRAFT_23641 [Ilyonectria robusta]